MKSNTRFKLAGTVRTLTALMAIAPGVPTTGQTQVGHSPRSSPYRPILARQVFGLSGGYLWGDRGEAGVGPSNGATVGGFFDLSFGGPVGLSFNVWYADLNRFVKDPSLPPEERTTGPFSQAMVALDGNIQLTLTGAKSWRRMAPYLGMGMGISFGGDIPEDITGFTFNAKFLFQPAVGIRLHLSDRLILSAEAKDVIWRLSYPPAYLLGAEPILDPLINKANEWTHHFMLRFSLGYATGF